MCSKVVNPCFLVCGSFVFCLFKKEEEKSYVLIRYMELKKVSR